MQRHFGCPENGIERGPRVRGPWPSGPTAGSPSCRCAPAAATACAGALFCAASDRDLPRASLPARAAQRGLPYEHRNSYVVVVLEVTEPTFGPRGPLALPCPRRNDPAPLPSLPRLHPDAQASKPVTRYLESGSCSHPEAECHVRPLDKVNRRVLGSSGCSPPAQTRPDSPGGDECREQLAPGRPHPDSGGLGRTRARLLALTRTLARRAALAFGVVGSIEY